jgi:hypothetical protein
VPLHVLQKILQLLLALMEEKSVLTQLSNHLLLYQRLMEQDTSVLVLVDLHLLMLLVVGQSLNNKKLIVEEKSNSQGDAINQ